MKAVILAAGYGERLSPITRNLPKCLLPIGSVTILERLLQQCKACHITEVAVIVGYQSNIVMEQIGSQYGLIPITYLQNDIYDRTSTAYSAFLADEWVGKDPFVLIDGDIVMEESVLRAAVESRETAIVFEAKSISSPEEMKVSKDKKGILHLSKETLPDESLGEFVGITAFTAEMARKFFDTLHQYSENRLQHTYYESVLNDLAACENAISTIQVKTDEWIEIDFVTDYLEAVRLFADKKDGFVPAPISEQVLLCPGPVMVSQRVKSALLHADIGHRETEFIEILTRTRSKLLKAYGAEKSGAYTDIIITGSGTAANETLLSSYGPGKSLLILSNGEFGNRLIDIAKCHHLDVTPLEFGWMQPVDLKQVESQLANGQFDAVMMVHHETSTGMLNPIYEVGKIAKQYNIDFLVDAVSSIGAEYLDLEKANITFCTASANKAIASLPGLAFVCGKRDAFAALDRNAAHTRYLDLYRHYEFEELHYQTPNTPAVSLFYALETALDELLADGIEARMAHCEELTSIIRINLKQLGMQFVIPEEYMSRVLTTVYYPGGIDVEAFHTWIKEHNFVIYRGKGPLLGKAFQIANIGHVQVEHVEKFLEVMKQGFEVAKNSKTAVRSGTN